MTDTPFDREEGRSWRHADDEDVCGPSPWRWCEGLCAPQPRRTAALFVLMCPFLATILVASASSCWLLALPGVLWVCIPVCLWAASEIHKLWGYWDGRVELVEEWP